MTAGEDLVDQRARAATEPQPPRPEDIRQDPPPETKLDHDKFGAAGVPKVITMSVKYHKVLRFFEVVSISNSIYYLPGEPIAPAVLKVINDERPNWEVNTVAAESPLDFGAIFGTIAGLIPGVGALTRFMRF